LHTGSVRAVPSFDIHFIACAVKPLLSAQHHLLTHHLPDIQSNLASSHHQ
jgi:hypothetical protein